MDLSGTVQSIKPNEKVYVYGEERAPGGNAINAARILNRLNVPVVISGFLGGSTGDEIEDLLKKEHVKTKFVKIAEATRINVTVANASDHQQTRLSFPGPKIRKDEKNQLLNLIATQQAISLLVIGGSLPAGVRSTDLRRMMTEAHARGIRSVVDCPGDILVQLIKGKPFMIKPNLEEFQILTRSRVNSIGSVLKKCRKLLSQVEMICVSSVEGGALLVTRKGAFFGRVPKINVRSSVGAGDSMVGAMVAQLYKGSIAESEILRWGLASAGATLEQTGTVLGQASEIRRLYKRIHVEKI